VRDDGRIELEGGIALLEEIDRGESLARYVELDEAGCLRTRGRPRTMSTLDADYGASIEEAGARFELPASWVAAMVSIEAARRGFRFDPRSLRREPGYVDDETTPHRISAGLMQTLLSTARQMSRSFGLGVTFGAERVPLALGDLMVPRRSLLLGAAYMRDRADRFGADPVLLVAAYNAGGVYHSSGNPWRLRTYGRTRIPKFVAYHNDWLAARARPSEARTS
jgi:soluble lytic murein transglycosylase-like protein